MGINIHIRFYNIFPPKIMYKTSFLWVEIIIRQFWKIAYLFFFRMPKEEQEHAQIMKKILLLWF